VDFAFDWQKYHRWLLSRFQVLVGRAIADTTLVASFSYSEEGAFQEYFNLLDEFLRSGSEPSAYPTGQTEKVSVLEMVGRMRRQSGPYSGIGTFLATCSYLMGDEHACQACGLLIDDDRRIFHEFQTWIESEKNRSGKTRPWFKIIQFWSAGFDCGEEFGALSLFYKWLDEYFQVIGRKG
jgi:hypothetical protein